MSASKVTKTKVLWLIGVLFCASATLNLFSGVEAAVAEQAKAELADEKPDMDAVILALQNREAALDDREASLEARAKEIENAEQQLYQARDALEAAEASLKATMAKADGAEEADLARLTSVYENMKPKDAAALFKEMAPEFAAGFLARMRPDAAAALVAGLEPKSAYAISLILANRNAKAPTKSVQ